MIKFYKAPNPHNGNPSGIRKVVRMEAAGPKVIAIIGQVGELIDLGIIEPLCTPVNDNWLLIPADGRAAREYHHLNDAKKEARAL